METAKGECRQLERNPLRNAQPVKFPVRAPQKKLPDTIILIIIINRYSIKSVAEDASPTAITSRDTSNYLQ